MSLILDSVQTSSNAKAERRLVLPFEAAVWIGFGLLHGVLLLMDAWPFPRRILGDEAMYLGFARSAARGEPASLDLLWPPLYGWFLTPLVTLGSGGLWVVILVQLALLVFAATLFRSLTRRWTGSEAAARFVWAFVLLDPQVGAFAHYLWPEVLHISMFVSLMWLLAARPGRMWWVLSGVTMGTTVLTKSLLQPFIPIISAALVKDMGWRKGVPAAAGIIVVAAALVLPTVVENGRRHGAWIIADSSRFTLWVGLNAKTRRSAAGDIAAAEYQRYLKSGTTFAERQAVLWAKLSGLWARRGPIELLSNQLSKQYFRLLDKDSYFTEQLPGGAFADGGDGYTRVPAPLVTALRTWSYGIYALVLTAAGPGLVATPLGGQPWLQMQWGLLGYGLLLFLGVEARSRYRVPLLLPLYLVAAITLSRPAEQRPDGRAIPVRFWLGAGLSILLLWLAFGGPLLEGT